MPTNYRKWTMRASLCLLLAAVVFAQQNPLPPPAKGQASQTQTKKPPPRQDAETEPDSGHLETIDTQEVLLDVAVVDMTGRPIETLLQDDFTVFEDKVRQPIESVRRTVVPLSLGLVIDTSGSMRVKLPEVVAAALIMIRQMQDGDEAFLAQFKAETELVRDFTRDKHDLEEGLKELFTAGETALLDAIIATADHAQAMGKLRKKALVIITDGLDKNSSFKEREVTKAIEEDDVQVYLIGIIDDMEAATGAFGKAMEKKGRNLLLRIAEDSGGRAFFPKDAREVADVMAKISKDLRSQYVVSYSPTNEKKDGTFRAIKVVVAPKDNRRLIVRTRQGYIARRPNAAVVETTLKKIQ